MAYLDPGGQRVGLGWHGSSVLLGLRVWLVELSMGEPLSVLVDSQADEMKLYRSPIVTSGIDQ